MRRFVALLLLTTTGLLAAGCSDAPPHQVSVEAAASDQFPSAPSPVAPKKASKLKGSRPAITFVKGFAAGQEAARSQHKPLLLFFTAEWCHFCHQMADEALVHPQVVSLSDRFVCAVIDADAEQPICRQMRVRGYPTVQFMSPDGVPLNRLTGKRNADQLIVEMQAALQAVARRETAEGNVIR